MKVWEAEEHVEFLNARIRELFNYKNYLRVCMRHEVQLVFDLPASRHQQNGEREIFTVTPTVEFQKDFHAFLNQRIRKLMEERDRLASCFMPI